MFSENKTRRGMLLGTTAIFAASFALGVGLTPVSAQDEDEDEDDVEEVIVTGSRIKRNEFTSPTPIQVVSGDVSREMGMFNTAQMMQTSNVASGVQIDTTFGGYVLDNGPGASTIGLRGLDPERTLVMVNGRRVAPTGAGGAPTSTDLNLIPAIMIERIETLTDGASTIYGSDAVAGVANVIMRKDVEGFEIGGNVSYPEAGAGEQYTANIMWGKTFDNGFINMGAEFYEQKAMSYGDNPFMAGCNEYYHEGNDGNFYTENRGDGPQASDFQNCKRPSLTNRIFIAGSFWGSVYYTPGYTNTGIPNFSETNVPLNLAGLLPNWYAGDSNGDGIPDVGFVDGLLDGSGADGNKDIDWQDPFWGHGNSSAQLAMHYIQPQKRASFYSNGEYQLDDKNNTTLYGEFLFAYREGESFRPTPQFFPDVPADYVYNPCNQNSPYGMNCMQGIFGLNWGSFEVTPIVNIKGDRDTRETTAYNYRAVAGVRGDLPVGNDWSYDVYVSHSKSVGQDKTQGINANRVQRSFLTTREDPNNPGSYICGNAGEGCVPVNFFAPNIYQEGQGELSPEEFAWLMSTRRIKTTVEQSVANAYVTGNLFKLPWNDLDVPIVIGAEYRKDKITTDANNIATEGVLFGWFSDKGANGERSFKELYAETVLDIAKGHEMAEELSLTASARLSNESYYDSAWTYSVKGVYRPVEWLTFRGGYGTSYRAPNMRERFLLGTTGFNSVIDPCMVPTDARDVDPLNPNAPATYNAAGDNREQHLLDACSATGVNPLTLGLADNSNTSRSVEIITGGSTTAQEETSKAKSYGIVFDQPFTDAFTLQISAQWYDISISNSIEEPSNGYIINQCYDNPDIAAGSSPFCNRITRDSDGMLSMLNAQFINIGLQTSKGVDFNIFYEQEFELKDKPLKISLDLRATQLKERREVIETLDEDYAGQTSYPEWRGSARLAAEYNDFRLAWMARFIGSAANTPGTFYDDNAPCDGIAGVSCRPVYYTTDYDVHTVSLTWSNDNFSITGGIENVFDTAPPRIDTAGVWGRSNVPLGIGYDTTGRGFFLNSRFKF